MTGTSPLVYPSNASERDRWILSRRPARRPRDPYRPYAYFVEDECAADGTIQPVTTIFLTNRECPFRCLMCDLWQDTLLETVPVGAIPAQIDHALKDLAPAQQLKLYNSGSFFDRAAIPLEDYAAIAQRADQFERLIVENHPALVNDACVRFRDRLEGRFEIAMGLETVHESVLDRLNKRMTLEQFTRAAHFLQAQQIDLRVFILVQPPFMAPADALYWAQRSLDYAMQHGATAVTLIPTRAGNGAMDTLVAQGHAAAPRLAVLECAMDYGLRLKAGRVFADLWALPEACPQCHPQRRARLLSMNLRQEVLDRISCAACGGLS